MYRRLTWQDHVTEHENRFRVTQNQDGTATHAPVEGAVMQEGTPQNARNFNNLEEGIFSGNDFAAYLLLLALQLQRGLRAAGGESGTATLTNTQEWPFSTSGMTIPISPNRDTLDYTVTLEVQSATGGSVGDLRVSNKLRNGFRISHDGSASQVVVRWSVTGGNI